MAAVAIAIRPEEHWRSMVMPLTVTGRPAARAAMRPMFRLVVPCGIAQPMITSSISAGSTPARSTAARIVGASVLLNRPR